MILIDVVEWFITTCRRTLLVIELDLQLVLEANKSSIHISDVD